MSSAHDVLSREPADPNRGKSEAIQRREAVRRACTRSLATMTAGDMEICLHHANAHGGDVAAQMAAFDAKAEELGYNVQR